jgi:D-3-phosphoglycerate dehydrogenase / 2-oxoglutarate reductase
MYRVLVTDEIDPDGVALLREEGELRVDEVPTLPKEELLERIGDYDALVGRSATRITEELLRRATRLRVIGRAGVGVDNIDLDTATKLGVAVINAPAGNSVAVAELLFAVLLAHLRQIPRADSSMHDGRWERSSLLGNELRGRTLGIVGVGRIGSEVATRAHAFGMQVVGYDPYISEERFRALRVTRAATLDELLDESDIVTVHVPLNEETTGMIGKRELGRLRSDAIVANLARGGIIDEAALVAALTSKQIAGAAVDVYSKEPMSPDNPLRTAPNVVLTPHIGASTAEAQRNVAVDVCAAVRDTLLSGELSRSLNVAGMEGTDWRELKPALEAARRAAAMARAILAERGTRVIQRLRVRGGSALAGALEALLSSAATGALEGVVDSERLNLINARALATGRGIDMFASEALADAPAHGVEVSLGGAMQELAVAATAAPGSSMRITRIGGFHVDIAPRDCLLILTNNDVPGVIGRVGTVLGDASINIAEYHQARLAQGGEALAAISVDGNVDENVRASLLAITDVTSATLVRFRK